MGLLTNLFRSKPEKPVSPPRLTNLAFVLLSEPRLPDAAAVCAAFAEFESNGGRLAIADDDSNSQHHEDILSFTLSSGESAFVALMPVAVPNGEADQGAQYSLGALGTGWTLPSHMAHLVVTFQATASSSLLDRVSRFTSLLAAIARTSPAVGVYWGNAGATHGADFFTTVAAEQGTTPRIMLWTGISVARETDGRLSLLSLGMQQLDLPDLLLLAPPSSSSSALETFLDLLAYEANRGKAIPDGDTVGRTEHEKLRVRYVKSPVDATKKVWRVELPKEA